MPLPNWWRVVSWAANTSVTMRLHSSSLLTCPSACWTATSAEMRSSVGFFRFSSIRELTYPDSPTTAVSTRAGMSPPCAMLNTRPMSVVQTRNVS